MSSTRIMFAMTALVFASIVSSQARALADDAALVVLDATGTAYHAGDKLTPMTAISLTEGQTLTLVATDGSVMTLKGPFSGPAKGSLEAKTASVSEMLTPLLQKASAENATPGVIRGSVVAGPRTDAWVIDTTQSGDVCIHTAVDYDFWRPNPKGVENISITGSDGFTTKVGFAAGTARVRVPDALTFKDNASYKITNPKGSQTIVVHTVPDSVAPESRMAAGWFASKKCAAQAEALLRSLLAKG